MNDKEPKPIKETALSALEPDERAGTPAAASPLPYPDAPHWLAWNAASWRAFGTLDTPRHIIRHRSFDDGTVQLPDEPDSDYAARQGEHRRFDGAERELMDLLASGRVKATGRPPARANGQQLYHAARDPVVIPAITFLNQQLAFTSCGELIDRVPSLKRLFPKHELHGSDADPRFPLYHHVLIEAAGLREAWVALPPFLPKTPTAVYRTGAAGRPTSKQLVQGELRRRAAAGPLQPQMSAEAVVLAEWLAREHPDAPRLTEKSIQNTLGAEYRELKSPK